MSAVIHHHGKCDAGQRVASLTGASVFDIVPRGAAPLIWKRWQTTDAGAPRLGAETGRPRVKFVDIAEMLASAR
jgi:ferredoxin--NADP+ reductase